MKKILFFLLTLSIVTDIHAQTSFLYKGNTMTTDTLTWLVKPEATVEELASGTVFCHVKDAMIAADSIQLMALEEVFTEEQPLTIYIAPWVYWMDDPDNPAIRKPAKGKGIPFGVEAELSHVRFIGLGESPEHTIWACNRGQTQGAEGNFTMLSLKGEDLYFENLTMGNYCNVDLEYAPNPKLNRRRRANAIVQAQLAICQGDRVAARNCRFISRLNTCPLVGAQRTFFEKCYFECTDDALCGTGIYLNCQFNLFSGKPFYSTQGTGAIFLNCDLHTHTNGQQYLVKVGSPVTMIDCRWTCEHPYLPINWTQDPTDDLRCYQYNLTQDGNPLTIDRKRAHLTIDLTGKQALEAFKLTLPKHSFSPNTKGDTTIYNILNLTGSYDGWNPAGQPEVMKAYTRKAVSLDINLRKHNLETGKEPLILKAVKLCFGQRPDFATPTNGLEWHVSGKNTECVILEEQPDGSVTVIGNNNGEEVETVNIIAIAPDGLETACVVTVHPRQLPPPAFVIPPTLSRDGNIIKLDYTLDLQGRADHSIVTWQRCLSPDGANSIPVAVSRMDTPLREYELSAADNGYYIRATIAAKNPRSSVGQIVNLTTNEPVRVTAEDIHSLHTDFMNFPTQRQTAIHPGFWTVDAYKPIDTRNYDWEVNTLFDPWHYGKGIDGAAGIEGLMQSVRGARLLYTPLPRDYSDMTLTLEVAPCKSAGQGFGSATGQYMDICIKMNTHQLTGYALRIIRTNRHDNAVDFQLMRYTNGEVTPISKAVSATCYRTGCHIQLKAEGNTLTATAINNKDLPETKRADLVKEVHLSVPIETNTYGGIGIQHTGSTGASATLLRELKVVWE